jgi:hypothetical protein
MDANPYGEVKDAWICIRASMTKISPSPLDSNEHEIRLGCAGMQPHPRMCTRYSSNENENIIVLDHEEAKRSGEWRQWDVELLLLGGYLKNSEEGTDDEPSGTAKGDGISDCYCLVVQKEEDGEGAGRWKRVGWLFLGEDETLKVREMEGNWTTITMI